MALPFKTYKARVPDNVQMSNMSAFLGGFGRLHLSVDQRAPSVHAAKFSIVDTHVVVVVVFAAMALDTVSSFYRTENCAR